MQELKAEQAKTEQTLSLWREYRRLSDRGAPLLRKLRPQWEDLCSPSPEPEPRGAVQVKRALLQSARRVLSGLRNETCADLLQLVGGGYGGKKRE